MFQLEDDGDGCDDGGNDCGKWEPSASDQEEFEEKQCNNSYLQNVWVFWLIQDGSESISTQTLCHSVQLVVTLGVCFAEKS